MRIQVLSIVQNWLKRNKKLKGPPKEINRTLVGLNFSAISEFLQSLYISLAYAGFELGRFCSPEIESNMLDAEKRKKNSNESILSQDLQWPWLQPDMGCGL